MRFGCCLNMLATKQDPAGLSYVPIAAQAGFDYVEPPLAAIVQLSEDQLCEAEGILLEHQLAAEAFCNLFPGDLPLTGPCRDAGRIAEYSERALAIAARFHARVVVFGSGMARTVPQGYSRERAWEELVETTGILGRIARERGLLIAIEPLNRKECNVINSFREGCILATDVKQPGVRVLTDYYHFALEGDRAEDLSVYGPEFLKHVHFADVKGRSYPNRLKQEYIPFLEEIKKAGYHDRMSLEGYSEDLLTDAPPALKMLREQLREKCG